MTFFLKSFWVLVPWVSRDVGGEFRNSKIVNEELLSKGE
jgi:hypothetical protein